MIACEEDLWVQTVEGKKNWDLTEAIVQTRRTSDCVPAGRCLLVAGGPERRAEIALTSFLSKQLLEPGMGCGEASRYAEFNERTEQWITLGLTTTR